MEAREKLLKLLEQCGAVKLRHKKHPRYRLKNGHSITIPNDHDSSRAWDGAYARLRGRLEPVAERVRRRQEELAARAKEPPQEYTPKHQQKQGFLAGLEPTDAIVKAPDQPQLRELPKAFETNPNQPHVSERVQTSWGVSHRAGSVKIEQRPSARHGGVKAFSPEIIAEANRIRIAFGEGESKKFLDSIHNQLQYTAPAAVTKPEKSEGMRMVITNVGGTIEETLNRTKQAYQQLIRQKEERLREISQIDLEILRATKIIQGLEDVVKIGSMTLGDFQLSSSNGNGNHKSAPRKRGRWKEFAKLAIESSPVPLTRSDLKNELLKVSDATPGAVYQGMLSLFNSGYLVEENRGDCLAIYINDPAEEGAGADEVGSVGQVI